MRLPTNQKIRKKEQTEVVRCVRVKKKMFLLQSKLTYSKLLQKRLTCHQGTKPRFE